jgi:hypothetical protein
MILTNIGRSVRREAASMGMSSSITDQVAASTLSQVPSLVLDAMLRVGMRIIEMIQVL